MQSWWNLAGAPGFVSVAAYGSGSVEEGLRNAATWACIDVLADAVSRTPLDAMRGLAGARRPVSPIPSLLTNPSGLVARDVWRYQLAWSMLTDGNSFGRVTSFTTARYPTSIEMLDPVAVTERKVVDGVAQVLYDNQTHFLYPTGDIWHVPGRMVPAGTPFGLSPIKYAAQATGTSLSAEEFSRRFFEDGGHPSALIYSNRDLTPDNAQQIKTSFRRATEGSREPVVFGADLKYEPIQVNPQDSQFIDLMRWEVEQACRFWRVPPAMVYAATSGQNITYANVTTSDLHYLKHSLDGYLVRLEESMTDLLPRPQYVRANRDAILRSDIKSRNEVHALRLQNKLATVNEIRALEDEPPFTGAEWDKPGIPGEPAPPPGTPPPQPGKPLP